MALRPVTTDDLRDVLAVPVTADDQPGDLVLDLSSPFGVTALGSSIRISSAKDSSQSRELR